MYILSLLIAGFSDTVFGVIGMQMLQLSALSLTGQAFGHFWQISLNTKIFVCIFIFCSFYHSCSGWGSYFCRWWLASFMCQMDNWSCKYI